METEQKPVMIVGIDESDHSIYALEWTLDHFLAPFAPNYPFQLIVVHAKPTLPSVMPLPGLPGFPSIGPADYLTRMEADLKRSAARVMQKAKELCLSKSVNNVIFEVMEGDARNVLCEAVEKHHATMLVVGSHGYGAIKRAVLGSVSDYVSHHAHCTVIIVKKPKIKHQGNIASSTSSK